MEPLVKIIGMLVAAEDRQRWEARELGYAVRHKGGRGCSGRRHRSASRSEASVIVVWMILLGLAGATSAIAQPTSPQIKVTVTGLEKNEVGEVAEVRFQVTAGMPLRAPKNPSREGDVLDYTPPIPGKLGPRWLDESRLDLVVVSVPNTVRLTGKGYIVIPPGQPMPLGVPFHNDHMRLVFPLYLPESEPRGSLTIRPLAAGSFRLNVSLISLTITGSLLREQVLFNQVRQLIDHSPVIVVQDRFTAPRPDAIYRSPSGRHELWVYKERFDIYSVKSGGLILSRVGTDPRFSLTGRFLTYSTRGKPQIVDVLDRKSVLALGVDAFSAGDAYLFSGGGYGAIYFASPFVDDNYIQDLHQTVDNTGWHYEPGKGWKVKFWSSILCHFCELAPSSVRLDVSKGLLVLDPDLKYSNVNTEGRETLKDLEPGKKVHDFYSLLTGDSWLTQKADTAESAAYLSDLFAHPSGFEDYSRFTSPAKNVLSKRAHNVAPLGQHFAANHGQPVFRTVDSSTTEIRPSTTAEVRGFLQQMGFEFPSISDPDEASHKEYPSSRDDPSGASARAYRTLLRELGDGHETLLKPVIEQGHATIESFQPDTEITHGQLDSTKMAVHYMVWKTPWGRVVFLAEVSGPGGSEGLYDADFCMFVISKMGFAASDSGRCFDAANFKTDLAWMTLDPNAMVILSGTSFAAIAIDIADRIFVVDLPRLNVVATIDGAVDTGAISYLGVSSDEKLLLQCNRDGKFFIYNMKSGKRLVSGLSVDDETVLFDDNGYYDSTPEGAHYVYWLFPGLGEHFTFSQFESRMHRPDVILDDLRGTAPRAQPVVLDAPPRVDLEMLTLRPDSRGQVRVRIAAQSQTGLKTIRLFVDGVPLEEIPLSGQAATINRSMPIPQGIHWVTTVAYDSSGYSSIPKSARVNGAASPLSKGRLFYVGVAVDQYPGIPGGNLRYAKRDMQLLADTFEARAAAQYSDAQTTLLADASATPEAIIGALQQATSSAKPEDSLIVSFAGHGVAGSGGRFFFLTSAATTADPTNGALDWARAAAVLLESRAKVIVLLDACHSGFASQETVVPNDAYAAALMRNNKAGMAVLAASKGREFSQEREGLEGGHGLFSYAVARALDRDRSIADWQHAGIIDLDELYRYVKNYVSQMTRDGPMPQTPWLSRDELIGQVPVL